MPNARTPAHRPPAAPHAAALAFEMELGAAVAGGAVATAPTRIRVLPDGPFAALDGRPGNIEGVTAKEWVLTAAAAQAVIAAFKAGGLQLVIDYDHQTLRSAANGQPAPAAGWVTGLEYVSGAGLMADVQWTPPGAALVASRQYRYLSPVFLYDPHTGEVDALHSVALTNTPALNVLGEIAALAALAHPPGSRRLPGPGRTTHEETMDKTKLLVALGLPLDTGDDTALTALAALTQKAAAQTQELAALRANQFDPAKHIPLDEHSKVTQELATLRGAQDRAEHEALMAAALSDARILPVNEPYWRAQPLAALGAFLKDAKPLVAALNQSQTGGRAPAGDGPATVALSAEEKQVCALMGLTPEAYAKARA